MAVAKATTRKAPAAGRTATTVNKAAPNKNDEEPEFEVSQNLRLLKAILDTSTKPTTATTKARRPKTPLANTKVKQASATGKLPTQTKNGLKTAERQGESLPESLSGSREWKNLATNSFNQSLKVLSALARKQQLNKQEKSSDTKTIITNPRSVAENAELHLHSDCACAALAVLRHSEDINQDSKDSVSKREQGAIILLERLVSLEMGALALTEASKIHEQYWKRRKGGNNHTTTSRKPAHLELSQLLIRDGLFELRKDFELVCSFQSQILRLAMLLGPEAVTQNFVEAISFDTSGSPAAVIQIGHRAGHIGKKEAGENLRTIAQALSKMYSVAVKSDSSPIHAKNYIFSLFVEAQLVRLTSWRMLKREVDLEQELWAPLERALKYFWHKQSQKNQARYDVTMSLVERIRYHSGQSPSDPVLPTNLLDFLARLAEENDDYVKAVSLLTDLSVLATQPRKLFLQCRLVTVQLDASASQDIVISSLINIDRSLDDVDHAGFSISSDDLLIVVRLRKACSQRLSMAATINAVGEGVVPACLQTLLAVTRFCTFQLHQICQKDVKLRRSLYLAVLKTIEALVDAEKYVASSPIAVLEVYLEILDSCVTCLTQVNSWHDSEDHVDQFTALNSLKLRLSNVFWRMHTNEGVASKQRSPIGLAQTSIDCLSGLLPEDLSKAALGPRLEKLASMHIATGASSCAKEVLSHAVRHYVATGALADAVEASLSKQREMAWSDPSCLAFQLGRALHSFNGLAGQVNSLDVLDHCLYDDDSLPDMHRAVLLEHQIMHCVKKRPEHAVFQTLFEHARQVTQLAICPQHSVWRLRFAFVFAFHASKADELDSESLTSIHQLLSAAETESTINEQAFLEPYRPILASLVQLQQSYNTGSLDPHIELDHLARIQSSVEHCTSIAELESIVDDNDCLVSMMRGHTDQSMALHKYMAAVMCLKIRLHLMECGATCQKYERLSCYSKLAVCNLKLNDLMAAEICLTRAQELLDVDQAEGRIAYDFHMVSAEFYLASSATAALVSCKVHLEHAQKEYQKEWPKSVSLSSRKQIERDSMVAQGALLASQLAGRCGNLALAHQYARQAAKISISIWAALDKLEAKVKTPAVQSGSASLVEDMTKLSIAPRKTSKCTSSFGARLWPYIGLHTDSLKHACSIMSSAGLFDDARHYMEQLHQTMSFIPQSHPSMSVAPALAVLYAKAGRQHDATRLLCAARGSLEGCSCVSVTDCLLTASEAYLALGEIDDACQYALKARPLTVAVPESSNDEDFKLAQKQEESKPTTKARRCANKAGAIRGPARRAKNNAGIPASNAIVLKTSSSSTSVFSFAQLHNEDRRKALLLILGLPNQEVDHHAGAVSYVPLRGLIQEAFAIAKSRLSQAWSSICADSMQFVFTESAIALPFKHVARGRNGRVSFLQGVDDTTAISPTKMQGLPEALSAPVKLFESAHRIVNNLLKERQRECPIDMVHLLAKMHARISLLLTTMNHPFTTSSTDLVLRVSAPQDDALGRERIITLAESATHDRTSLSVWPTLPSAAVVKDQTLSAEHLNDLPATWSIVSITLTEDHDELLLSKIVAGQSPFLIRIPLRRSNEGDGTDSFMFDDAMTEMKSIIDCANSSSHDIRGTADKPTRARWHADREKLDAKLQMLLSNIEAIWLGGFRGILSPTKVDQIQLRDFGAALNQSLDQHLPTRQKSSSATQKIDIHDHILESFLGLGNPDKADLDDAIVDLLYFVVDILQFNGERNAYDEIDWDAMLVDIIDALRSSHEGSKPLPQRHTILILDKELECFPWESLPCLIEHPVSRMPSLGSIFDHLAMIRAQQGNDDTLVVSKSTAKVASIINPSGDLKSTQALFEPVLASSLPVQQYTPQVGEALHEARFLELLTDSDILLYFGHGSGAQYIRGRTIRSSSKLAVTFLFGCSSAKMTEHGSFESTGMPRYYMLGHSPAVVGCLWDVTDREIDRVALKTISEWGLVDREDAEVKEALRKKGRKHKEASTQKHVAIPGPKKAKTLVEAVREGREACMLRYLCGAAVVVYGVPIVLSE